MIDGQTKVIARLHTDVNSRGLNIYNPYFVAKNINAVYLLFHDPDLNKLISGMRNLNLAGAITAGFESDPKLVTLMDELSPTAKRINRVTLVVNRSGKLIGHYNAGLGLANAIKTVSQIKGKDVVIMGAGNVVKGLLSHLEEVNEYPSTVSVYNRTVANAKALVAEGFKVDKTGSLDDMIKSGGDIFIHATDIGAPWNKGGGFNFTPEFLKRFKAIADTTFVPLEPPIIKLANKAKIPNSPGWKMFVYQGAKGMGDIIGEDIDIAKLSELSRKDFASNWD